MCLCFCYTGYQKQCLHCATLTMLQVLYIIADVQLQDYIIADVQLQDY